MSNVTQTPHESSPQSAVKDGIDTRPVLVRRPAVSPEQLMPYGEAAKAIFVKANGLAAYNRGIRFVRRAD